MFVCLEMHGQLPCGREISGKEKETTTIKAQKQEMEWLEGGETVKRVSNLSGVCSVFVGMMLDEIAEGFSCHAENILWDNGFT